MTENIKKELEGVEINDAELENVSGGAAVTPAFVGALPPKLDGHTIEQKDRITPKLKS